MDSLGSLGSLGFFDKPESNFGMKNPPMTLKNDSLPDTMSTPGEYSGVLQDVATEYPALAPHVNNYIAYPSSRPQGEEGNGLETYMPWEDFNPHPGKITSEIYSPPKTRSEAKSMIAGDLIHYLGATNPDTGKPVDPTYYKLKQEVKRARSPEQRAIDYTEWKNDVKQGDTRTFDQWFDQSRGEAYVRGRLFPDQNDEWRSWYAENPKLKKAVDKVGSYLKTGREQVSLKDLSDNPAKAVYLLNNKPSLINDLDPESKNLVKDFFRGKAGAVKELYTYFGKQAPLNPYLNAESEPREEAFARNKKWSKPSDTGYVTNLPPDQEKRFQAWAHQPENWDYVRNDMGTNPGYDIRGWFKAMESGDPLAQRDPVDLHFSDKWKTPYSPVFSNQSIYALPTAPHWEGNDREGWTAVTHDGRPVTIQWWPKKVTPKKTKSVTDALQSK